MPLYQLTIHDGSGLPDPEPVEFRDDAAARSQSVVIAGEMLRDADGSFWENSHWRIEATNEAGQVICSITVEGSAPQPPG